MHIRVLSMLALLISSASAVELVLPDSPFDSYGNLCFEDEKIHLDNFAIAVDQNPNWVGYIIVYAGNESCAGEAQYRANRAKQYVVKRGIAAQRIIVKDGGYRTDVSTQLQPWPKDKPLYEILRGELSIKEVKIFKHCKIFRQENVPLR